VIYKVISIREVVSSPLSSPSPQDFDTTAAETVPLAPTVLKQNVAFETTRPKASCPIRIAHPYGKKNFDPGHKLATKRLVTKTRRRPVAELVEATVLHSEVVNVKKRNVPADHNPARIFYSHCLTKLIIIVILY